MNASGLAAAAAFACSLAGTGDCAIPFKLVDKVSHATVLVVAAGDAGSYMTGTAFLVNEQGTALTCRHVVSSARSLFVVARDGRTLEARVVAVDDKADLAAIEISSAPRTSLALAGPDDGHVGDDVVVVGNPTIHAFTASAGIISAFRPNSPDGDHKYRVVQIDAGIWSGSSGSAIVLSPSGLVVGVAFATYMQDFRGGRLVQEGLNYGVDASVASEFLSRNGIRHYVGKNGGR